MYYFIKRKRKLYENARGNLDFLKIPQNRANSYKNLYKTKQNLQKSHNNIRNHIKAYKIWMRNILQHLATYYKSIQHLRKREQSNTKPYKTRCENAILSASFKRSLYERALGERSKRELYESAAVIFCVILHHVCKKMLFFICFCMSFIDSVAKSLLFASFCKLLTSAPQKKPKNLRTY